MVGLDAVNHPASKENKLVKVHVVPNVLHIAGKAFSVTMRSELSKHKTRQPLYEMENNMKKQS